MTARDAILACFRAHPHAELTTAQVRAWIEGNFRQRWEDIGTTLGDLKLEGDRKEMYPREKRFLEAVARGTYRVVPSLWRSLALPSFGEFADFSTTWGHLRVLAEVEVGRVVPTLTGTSSVEILEVEPDAIRVRTVPDGNVRRLPEAEFAKEWRSLHAKGSTGSAGNRATLGLWAAYFSDLGPPRVKDRRVTPLTWSSFGLGKAKAAVDASIDVEEAEDARRRGQAFVSSPKRRQVIEALAMAEAKAHFVALGYKVTDMSASCPYDYAAEKGTDVIYIEVKGTSTAGERVILTYGEVEHARAHRGQMVLFILRNVQVTGTPENPVASGGTRTVVEPWEVDAGALTPISYMHRVPVHAPPS